MNSSRALNAPWLTSGPTSRVLQLLNDNGEEARVVGGAVRNALLDIPCGDNRYRDHGGPCRSDPPRQGGRHQERADRHRPRHRDPGGRCAAVRGDDAARGYRDLRPQGQGRVRPRLGGRCASARLHHQCAVGWRRWHRARLCRRARRYRFAPRALHRPRRTAHRRGLPAHPALFPHARGIWYRRGGPRRISRLHRGPGRPCDALGRTAADGDAQAAGRRWRPGRGHRDGGWRPAAADFRRHRL